MSSFEVTEAGIADIRRAPAGRPVSSVELVEAYLRRIDAYDRNGLKLNAVVVFNDNALAEAAASDQRRARGELLGPLDGIPYTAWRQLPGQGPDRRFGVACIRPWSPQKDAFAIEQLRRGGAVLIGLTNMPPPTAGCSAACTAGLKAPTAQTFDIRLGFGIRSNGSGTATAASFAAFGLGGRRRGRAAGRRPPTTRCAPTPLARDDLGPWQLAAGPDHGRRRRTPERWPTWPRS